MPIKKTGRQSRRAGFTTKAGMSPVPVTNKDDSLNSLVQPLTIPYKPGHSPIETESEVPIG